MLEADLGRAARASSAGSRTSITSRSRRRYLVTAFVYFLLGGMLAALMRLQLSRPDNTLIGPDLYNQIFTTHGTTMMFLFAVPVMQALGIYFVPLMVGARSIAFPRLVAFSYWMFLFGGIFLLRLVPAQRRTGRRLVLLSAAVRDALLAEQARRRLGAADHLHRGRVAGDRGLARSPPSSSCARRA